MGIRGKQFKKRGGWAQGNIRNYILRTKGMVCHWCKCHVIRQFNDSPHCTENTATIDHVRPRGKGGSDHPTNLVVACFYCNQKRGDEFSRQLQTKQAKTTELEMGL